MFGTTGCAGNNGPALSARFYYPNNLAVSGSQLFVSDYSNGAVRVVTNFLAGSAVTVATVAGTCGVAGFGGDLGLVSADSMWRRRG